jgi:hypothetical protein
VPALIWKAIAMTNKPPGQVNFLDNAGGSVMCADAATGWLLLNGNIRVTLEATRASHITSPGPINPVIIGRLIMPLDGAEEMAKGLLDYINQMKAQASTLLSA